MATPSTRQSGHISEGKGSPQASTIVTACHPYFTGFEPPSIMIAKVVWVRLITDQFKLTWDLNLHQQIIKASKQ